MISIMIKSAIVLAMAACIASALRRQSAALRHAIWTAGLIGALVVPLCSITLPAWQNGFVGWAERMFQAGTVETSTPASAVVPTEAAAISSAEASPIAPPRTATEPARSWAISQIAVAVWIGGAAIGLLFMLFGALRLAWVAIRSEPVTDRRWIEMAERVRQSLGFRRPVRLLQNQSGHFLGTWGILVPRVLLPSSANQWSDDRAWMVLGHELAHIKRHDWVVQVLAEAARAIYWFNPVFWLAYGRLRRESEHACDDTVIRMGAAGTQYAEELLELARTLRSENPMRSPILAMAQPSHLERRLVALLDPALNRLAATPWSVIVVALVAIGLTLPLAAVRAPDRAPLTVSIPPASAPVSLPPASPDPDKAPAKPEGAGTRNTATANSTIAGIGKRGSAGIPSGSDTGSSGISDNLELESCADSDIEVDCAIGCRATSGGAPANRVQDFAGHSGNQNEGDEIGARLGSVAYQRRSHDLGLGPALYRRRSREYHVDEAGERGSGHHRPAARRRIRSTEDPAG